MATRRAGAEAGVSLLSLSSSSSDLRYYVSINCTHTHAHPAHCIVVSFQTSVFFFFCWAPWGELPIKSARTNRCMQHTHPHTHAHTQHQIITHTHNTPHHTHTHNTPHLNKLKTYNIKFSIKCNFFDSH